LLALLQRRCELSTRADLAKRSAGESVPDPAGETDLLEQRRLWAEQCGLPGEVVQTIFRHVVAMSRQVQR
jgi:chorismate mutase